MTFTLTQTPSFQWAVVGTLLVLFGVPVLLPPLFSWLAARRQTRRVMYQAYGLYPSRRGCSLGLVLSLFVFGIGLYLLAWPWLPQRWHLSFGPGPITQIMQTPAPDVLDQAPTITAAQIDQVLAAAHSPAHGLGATLYRLGVQYGIDPAFALAFFHHESDYGTRGVAVVTRSLGNIRCTPGSSCYHGYRRYDTWAEGAQDWYRLIHDAYIGHGLATVEAIIPVYAPATDGNHVAAYVSAVMGDVTSWRRGRALALTREVR